jgi:hypothetical protein
MPERESFPTNRQMHRKLRAVDSETAAKAAHRSALARSVRVLRLLLHDELIHARERVRVLLLVGVPMIEVGAGQIVWKLRTISEQYIGIMLDAEQCKSIIGEEILDLGERETMLLNVKQEIAAVAGGVEIASAGDCPCG